MPPDTGPSIVDATDDLTTKANGGWTSCLICNRLCAILSVVVVMHSSV